MNLHTKFEVSLFTHYEDMKGNVKTVATVSKPDSFAFDDVRRLNKKLCRCRGTAQRVLSLVITKVTFKLTQGHCMAIAPVDSISLYLCLYLAPFPRYYRLLPKIEKVTWLQPCPLEGLFCQPKDLQYVTWPTYTSNLKSLCLFTMTIERQRKMWKLGCYGGLWVTQGHW